MATALNAQDLRLSLKSVVSKAQALAAKFPDGNMPSDVQVEINSLLGESDVIRARLETVDRLEKAGNFVDQPVAPAAATFRASGPDEGMVDIDSKSWREVEIPTARGLRKMRFHVPLAVQKKGYEGAFESYLRNGKAGMGPTDLKTLQEAVDTSGGFLVPQDYHPQIIKKLAALTAIRPNARVVQTSRDVATWPRVNYSTDDKYTSGVRLTWTGESPASSTVHRVTDQVYGVINIPAGTAMASQPITNDLMEDSAFDVLGESTNLFAEAFGLGEDDAFLNGNGIGRPMGLLTEAGGNGPAQVSSGTSAQIFTAADAHNGKRLVDLYYTVPAQYRRAAVWVMNSGTMNQVENLVDAQKRPLIQSLTAASVGMGEPDVIKNRPIFIDEFVPDVASNSNSIVFGDLNGYIIVDRVALSIQRLTEVYAEQNLVVLLARRRVGGYCAEPYRLKVLKCG